MPIISIITPTFNSAQYIEETYRSVLSQTFADWEWLIIDDCSGDETTAVLKEFEARDKRIKVYRNENNSGASFSRNVGLDHAAGVFIAFLDADDEWRPEKLATQLSFMKDTGASISCHDYVIMTDEKIPTVTVRMHSRVTLSEISAYNPLATSFMMLRRDLIGTQRFDLTLRRRQDWVFWYQLLKSGSEARGLNQVLGSYRKSIRSLSSDKLKMAQIQWNMYRRYFGLGLVASTLAFIRYACYGIKKHYLARR